MSLKTCLKATLDGCILDIYKYVITLYGMFSNSKLRQIILS